jgi:DNA polymerase
MKPYGDFKKGILNIGEAPGEHEDRRGKQWQGKTGRALKAMYDSLGINLFKDCININAINCRPTKDSGNREPEDEEITSCRRRVFEVIDEYKPKLIMLFGGCAVKSVIGSRWTKDLGGISRWRGWTIPDRELNAWICPVFHPSYVERGEAQIEVIWEKDLRRAFRKIGKPIPEFIDERTQIEILTNPKDIRRMLIDVMQGTPFHPYFVAFDYETTGMKPQRKGHKIICASVCAEPGKAYAFMMMEEIWRIWRVFLRSDIGKIAQNLKHEDNWSKVLQKTDVKNWAWDPMLAARLLAGRPGCASLKFQAYVRYGLPNWQYDWVEDFLEMEDNKDGNSFNRIEELVKSERGQRMLLEYCGIDGLKTLPLSLEQMQEMGLDPEKIARGIL